MAERMETHEANADVRTSGSFFATGGEEVRQRVEDMHNGKAWPPNRD